MSRNMLDRSNIY